MKAKVLKCDGDKAKMLLSFKGAMEGGAEKSAAADFDCKVGQVRRRPSRLRASRRDGFSGFDPNVRVCATQKLEARVLKKTAGGLEVAILPDEVRATLPMMHLSDHMSNCPLLWECLQEGDNVSNLICINRPQQNIVSFGVRLITAGTLAFCVRRLPSTFR